MIPGSTFPIPPMSQQVRGTRSTWSRRDIDCFRLRAVPENDVRQLSLVARNQSWQNRLRNGICEGPAGLVSVKAQGFIDWISVADAWESSHEITSRPENTLFVGFSDSLWGAVSALRVSANITRPILWSVRPSLTWHVDTVSEKNSPASSNSSLSYKESLQL